MTFFQDRPDEWQRLDFRILQNGWSNLYWKQGILDNDIEWFRSENFEIVQFDCTKWKEADNIHKDLKVMLGFPDYYGANFDALNDCLSDLEISSGLVVVFRSFHLLDKKISHSLLDVFANNSRQHLLFGRKLLTLVQVDDPNYQIDPIGACAVLWNSEEWLNSNRSR